MAMAARPASIIALTMFTFDGTAIGNGNSPSQRFVDGAGGMQHLQQQPSAQCRSSLAGGCATSSSPEKRLKRWRVRARKSAGL